MTIRLASVLRDHAAGQASVAVDVAGDGATVAAVLDELDRLHPGVGRRIRDERGTLRRHVNVFVGDEECRRLGGLDAIVSDGGELSVLAAVSGGAA
ncbi:MAG: MoaD/ThiS family protein [Actinomycetota bacterium]